MNAKIVLRITPDGNIFAETQGIKGKKCLSYLSLFERLTDAKTIDSEFTAEYHQTEVEFTEQVERQQQDEQSS